MVPSRSCNRLAKRRTHWIYQRVGSQSIPCLTVLLLPYIKPAFPRQARPASPPPINVEGHPEFEVDSILRSRKRPGRPPRNKPHPIQYLVHWKGYTHEHDTWQNPEDLENAQDAIDDFLHHERNRNILQSLASGRSP